MPPAARVTDMHTCPLLTVLVPHVGGPILPPGCITVLIGFMPAARMTDLATCVGPPDAILKGSPTVLTGFLMQARMGDPTVHGGVIVLGCPTVIVGDAGSGGGGGGGGGGAGGGGGGAGGAVPAASAPATAAPLAATATPSTTPEAASTPSPSTRAATSVELQHGKDMAAYAGDSYNDPADATIPRMDRSELSPEVNEILDNPKEGFSAAVYAPDSDHIVIAYRGTELSDPNDLWTDVKQALGFHSEQYDQAQDLALAVQAQYPDKQIELTGHSLGGGLAQYASAVTGLPATTFNAAGVSSNTLGGFSIDPILVTNFRVERDGLTGFQESSISSLLVPAAGGKQITLPLPPPDPNRNIFQKAIDSVSSPVTHHLMTSVNSGLDYALQRQGGGN